MTSTGITLAYDVTSSNYAQAPKGAQLALYCTGSPDIMATAAMRSAHPDAVLIDQSPDLTLIDEEADVLDFENGAATLADLAPWSRAALLNYKEGARPGQRSPLIYMSASDVTNVANALVAGKVTGVGLFIAKWAMSESAAMAQILAASGPFPIHGFQIADDGPFDFDLFSTAWLAARSRRTGQVSARG
jgi:hypothetical protein